MADLKFFREKLDEDKEAYRHSPPQPDAISSMEETIQWIFFLESEQEKRLIWLRAEGVKWKQICGRIGCGRTKAWHLWVVALLKIATRLNNGGIPKRNGGEMFEQKKTKQVEQKPLYCLRQSIEVCKTHLPHSY